MEYYNRTCLAIEDRSFEANYTNKAKEGIVPKINIYMDLPREVGIIKNWSK